MILQHFNGGVPAPYTHWAYFADLEAARACAEWLHGSGFACGVVRDVDDAEWLLRAHDVTGTRDGDVTKAVATFGGKYDGGEGYFSLAEGRAVSDADVGDRWPAAV